MSWCHPVCSGPCSAVYQWSRCDWQEHSGWQGHHWILERCLQLSSVHPVWTGPAELQREADVGIHVPLVSHVSLVHIHTCWWLICEQHTECPAGLRSWFLSAYLFVLLCVFVPDCLPSAHSCLLKSAAQGSRCWRPTSSSCTAFKRSQVSDVKWWNYGDWRDWISRSGRPNEIK